jgi:hypothetical protein
MAWQKIQVRETKAMCACVEKFRDIIEKARDHKYFLAMFQLYATSLILSLIVMEKQQVNRFGKMSGPKSISPS